MNELFRENRGDRVSENILGHSTLGENYSRSAIFAKRIWFRVTYQHGRSRRIHRNGWRTGRRSSCRSRSCPPCYRTACPPRTLCTCCRGSTPRASAYPCTTSPANDSSADYRLLVLSRLTEVVIGTGFVSPGETSDEDAGDEEEIWMKQVKKDKSSTFREFSRSL